MIPSDRKAHQGRLNRLETIVLVAVACAVLALALLGTAAQIPPSIVGVRWGSAPKTRIALHSAAPQRHSSLEHGVVAVNWSSKASPAA